MGEQSGAPQGEVREQLVRDLRGLVDPARPFNKLWVTRGDARILLALLAGEQPIKRHDCESWRMEGVGCANCNPIAREIIKEYPNDLPPLWWQPRPGREGQERERWLSPGPPTPRRVKQPLDTSNGPTG